MPTPGHHGKGAVAGRFRLQRRIASGAEGEVWRGVDLETNQPVAVKVVRNECRAANTRAQDVARGDRPCPFDEARVLRSLPPHRNVADLTCIASCRTRLYLVQELCRRGDLLDLITSEWRANGWGDVVLGDGTTRRLFSDLADALHHLHSNGVAHRDVKTENCLVADDGRLVLADFGFATRRTVCSQRCGTTRYMAPELLASSLSPYDPAKCDVWACGVVLFAMLTARLPFDGATDGEIARAVVGRKLRVPDSVPPRARDLLEAMLVVDPDLRPSMAQVRAHPYLVGEQQPQQQQQQQQHTACSSRQRSPSAPPSRASY